VESLQAREDRKKRVCWFCLVLCGLTLNTFYFILFLILLQKEAKKAAKLQAQLVQHSGKPVPSISPSTSTQIAQPQPLHGARSTGTPKQSVGTPRPGPTNIAARPIVRVGSTVPRPESAAPKSATPIQEQAGAPVITRKGTPMEVDQHRGKKREREEGPPVVNGTHVNVNGGAVPAVITNGYANGVPNGLPNMNGLVQQKQTAIALNAKAGTGGVRPRPIKKQRVVRHCSFIFSVQSLTIRLYPGYVRTSQRCHRTCSTTHTSRRMRISWIRPGEERLPGAWFLYPHNTMLS
jgi:hypothetical protein